MTLDYREKINQLKHQDVKKAAETEGSLNTF